MKRVSFMDATGEANLASLITDIQKQGGKLLISGGKPEVLDMMKTSGLYETIGEENFYEDATDAINQGLQIINVKKCAFCSVRAIANSHVFQLMTTAPRTGV